MSLALKEALKGEDNNDEVKAAIDDLNTKAAAMGQAMYAAAQAQTASESTDEADSAGGAESTDEGDDVVDAEIVEDEPKDDQ